MILKTILKRAFERIAGAADGRATVLLRDGRQRESAGDDAGAERQYRAVLAIQPGHAAAVLALGSLLGRCDRVTEAEVLLQQAVALAPQSADAHAALGNVHLMRGDFGAAQEAYSRALQLAPSNPAAVFNAGFLCQCRMDFAGALERYEHAYNLAPGMPGLLRRLTLMRLELGQYEAAGSLVDAVLSVRPDDADAQFSMGLVLLQTGRPQSALVHFGRACAHGGADSELWLNEGIALRDLGRIDEALAKFESVLAAKPGAELALWHRTLTRLLQQDFARGWEHYDLRLRSRDRPQRAVGFSLWDGRDPAGVRVLVHGEQGIGDEIMFASCLPQMIAASAACTVECSARLLGLFRRSFPAARVIESGLAEAAAESCDVQIAMGSLPRFLRRSRDDFPRHGGYLHADPGLRAQWRARLAAIGPAPKVGISWLGGTQKSRSSARSIALDALAPVLQVGGLQFVDLQYTDRSAEIGAVESRLGLRLHRWTEAREDFEHTAALIAELDLVISVCNTAVHLGGALGKPVWVMTPFSPEWRYGLRGDEMIWYPAARMFRQTAPGAWDGVIADVAQSLHLWRDRMVASHGR